MEGYLYARAPAEGYWSRLAPGLGAPTHFATDRALVTVPVPNQQQPRWPFARQAEVASQGNWLPANVPQPHLAVPYNPFTMLHVVRELESGDYTVQPHAMGVWLGDPQPMPWLPLRY